MIGIVVAAVIIAGVTALALALILRGPNRRKVIAGVAVTVFVLLVAGGVVADQPDGDEGWTPAVEAPPQ